MGRAGAGGRPVDSEQENGTGFVGGELTRPLYQIMNTIWGQRRYFRYVVIATVIVSVWAIVRTLAVGHAVARCEAGGSATSISACTDLIRRNPRDWSAYVNRGIGYADVGDPAQAIGDFGMAIKIYPLDGLAYNNRAWGFLKMGVPLEGLPDIEKALQLRPTDARFLGTRGHIFEALGRHEDAIADFRRALAFKPDHQSSKEALQRLNATP
jgi:tetratricopeptide (TPR) repeat protein